MSLFYEALALRNIIKNSNKKINLKDNILMSDSVAFVETNKLLYI